jgi:hypothetical protein
MVAKMPVGKALGSTFVIASRASHQLLLLSARSAAHFHEEAERGDAAQDRHRVAITKYRDTPVFHRTEREGQVAVESRVHVRQALFHVDAVTVLQSDNARAAGAPGYASQPPANLCSVGGEFRVELCRKGSLFRGDLEAVHVEHKGRHDKKRQCI